MLSTLKVTSRLSGCHGNIRDQTSGLLSRVTLSRQKYVIGTCGLHNDRETAPDIQDYEPYSKLPYYDGKKGHLMYVGNMTKMVKGIKTFSLSTSLVSIGSIPLIRSAIEDSLTKAGVMGSISALIFLTPLLLHFVTRKYVTDIYFNAETEVYTLATRSLLLRRKEIKYYATDVEVPFVGGAVVTHRVKKRPYFIEKELFFNKDVYIKMVGYDKPLAEFKEDPIFRDETKEVKTRMGKNEDFGLFTNKEVEGKTALKSKEKTNTSDREKQSKTETKKFGLFNGKE